MTATLYRTPHSPSTVTASTAAAGYAATNVLTTSIGRPWRSTTTGSTTLIVDLGSSKAVVGIAVNHINASSVTVHADNSATPTTSRGTLTSYADEQGRRKGMLAFSATVRYLMLTFSGTPTDAAAYWTAGSVYVFSASGALPRDPLMGSDQSVDYPQLTQRLPNGQTLRIDRGVSRMSVRLRFNGRITDDIAALARYARSGTVWLDMGLPTAQGCQWPLTHVDDGITRQWAGHNREPMTIPLLELA